MDLHTSFNTFDYVVIGCVLLSGLLALIRGLVREVCSLAAWAGAFVAAAKFSYLAEPWAHRYIKSDSLASHAAMVATFFAAFVVLSLIGMLICKLVQGDALTAIDRSLGFVFGLLRGTLLVCLLYLVAISTFWPDLDVPYSAGDEAAMSGDRSANVADLAMPPPISRGPSQQEEGGAAPSPRGTERRPDSGDHAQIQWLEQAKTRPFLARGAHWLRSLLPVNAAEVARERRGAFERQIERGAQELMMQQGTGARPESNDRSPSYDNTSRSGMDDLINKNEGTR
ncbi:MAG: CvpA family protein [Bdellovibrionales bacterium]